MKIHFAPGCNAKAYVVTGALAMITAEIYVQNEEAEPVLFSVYDAAFDPHGNCVTTTETLYRLESGSSCMITDELIRIKEPENECQGYTIRSTLLAYGQVADKQTLQVEVVQDDNIQDENAGEAFARQ